MIGFIAFQSMESLPLVNILQQKSLRSAGSPACGGRKQHALMMLISISIQGKADIYLSVQQLDEQLRTIQPHPAGSSERSQ